MKMKKIFTLLFVLITTTIFAQTVTITGTAFTIKHKDLTFYLDTDTNTYISVHHVKNNQLKTLTGVRKDRWHTEAPYGPYKKTYYVNTGYDLGHLTPSKITMYDDSTNYYTFSMFNQAPQLAAFNEHPWERLEMSVIDTILKSKADATIITGVIYDNNHKTYLNKSRIKIPIDYYKIVVMSNGTILAWIGSNINGLITTVDINNIIEIAKKNGNVLNIRVDK